MFIPHVQPGQLIRSSAHNNMADQINTNTGDITKANTAITNNATNISEALSKSADAVRTADTAKTTADTAKTRADTAKTTADTAKTRADTAVNTANTANSNVGRAMINCNLLPTGPGFMLNFQTNDGSIIEVDLMPLIDFIKNGM